MAGAWRRRFREYSPPSRTPHRQSQAPSHPSAVRLRPFAARSAWVPLGSRHGHPDEEFRLHWWRHSCRCRRRRRAPSRLPAPCTHDPPAAPASAGPASTGRRFQSKPRMQELRRDCVRRLPKSVRPANPPSTHRRKIQKEKPEAPPLTRMAQIREKCASRDGSRE